MVYTVALSKAKKTVEEEWPPQAVNPGRKGVIIQCPDRLRLA